MTSLEEYQIVFKWNILFRVWWRCDEDHDDDYDYDVDDGINDHNDDADDLL